METNRKYDISAIALAIQKKPHFLSRSWDGKLIMRRDEEGNFVLLAHDQETIVEISAIDARDFALWILMANVHPRNTDLMTNESTTDVRHKALFGLSGLAMLHPAQVYEKNETVAGGFCDFCGERANALKIFNRAPMAGACYCRKCAPLAATDDDWSDIHSMNTSNEES